MDEHPEPARAMLFSICSRARDGSPGSTGQQKCRVRVGCSRERKHKTVVSFTGGAPRQLWSHDARIVVQHSGRPSTELEQIHLCRHKDV